MTDPYVSPPAPPARPPAAAPADIAWKVGGAAALLLLALVAAGLVALVLLGRTGALGPGTTPALSGDAFAVDPRDAPPLDLVDQDGQPFSLPLLRGDPVLVFFGYTHCPDVCPATLGIIKEALMASGSEAHIVFVSVDPDRDDPAALKSYVRYLPEGFVALTGTPAQIRDMADAWDVTYAKIDTGSASGYAMAHTADLYLLDAAGRLRAIFPFGTEAAPIAAALELLDAEAAAATPLPATPSPATAPPATPGSTVPPVVDALPMMPVVVSTSVWAGGASPVILNLFDGTSTGLAHPSLVARAQLTDASGAPVGPEVPAVVVRPTGVTEVSVVATVDIPSPGAWGLTVIATQDGRTYAGSTRLRALDPGDTPALGRLAPSIRTPTLADVGGVAAAVTTAPAPDLRLSSVSTVDATARGVPYVLIVDSYAFRVSPACGRALTMARYLLDRWTDVAFIHLEPYEYTLVGTTPILQGSLQAPVLNRYAKGWGMATGPWTAVDVPWVFVVDGDGIVRAKSTGVLGSPDVDVILAMLAAGG